MITLVVDLGAGGSGEAIAAVPAAIIGPTTFTLTGGSSTVDITIDAPGTGYQLSASGTAVIDTAFSVPFDVDPPVPTP